MNDAGGRGFPAAVRLAPWIAGGIVAAVAFATLSPQPAGVFWDDGVYLITGRAIASGDGYRFAHLPGAPAAVHFPPGWPLVLALGWMVAPDFPDNLPLFRLLNVVLAAVGAALACSFGVRRLGLHPRLATLTAVLFALFLPVLVLDSVLFAEPLFLALGLVALFATERAARDGGWRAAILAGAAAGAATLTRSAAITLVPAIAVAIGSARRRREAAIAVLTAAVAVAPWQWWSMARAHELAAPLQGNYGPYLPWLASAVGERGPGFLGRIVAQNAVALQRAVAVTFFPVGVRPVRPLLVSLVVTLGILGFVVTWRRSRALGAFLVCYALLVLVWPYAPDRFAWAVWPLVGLVLAAGAAEAWRFMADRGHPRGVRFSAGVLVAVACLAGAGAAFYTARGVSRGWVDVAQRRNADRLRPVVEWVLARTPPDAIVASDGEPLVHLYTGRRVVPVHVLSPDEHFAGTPVAQAADDLRALIVAGRAQFAVLSAGSGEIAAAAMLAGGPAFPRLVPVDTLPGGGVAYRVQWQE